jgi:uncharacterized protein YjbJ (UPF0337 family)
MSGKSDKVKGRIKEAAGVLTGDAKLKREGKLDQVRGSIKNAVSTLVDKTKKSLGAPKK